MHLSELLQWLKFGNKTGSIVFELKGIVKKVFVEDGMIVSASSNDPKEYLGQVLICFGWISEEQLQEAFQMQAVTKKLIGRLLVEHFKLAEADILKALRIKIEETIYDLFLWKDGKFIYSDGIPQIAKHDRLDSPMVIDHALFEGARRIDEYKEFRNTFPNDDVVFALKGPRRELADIAGDPFLEKVYAAIDGIRSVQRILLESRVPVYRGYEAFAKLYWNKFAEAVVGTIRSDPNQGAEPTNLLQSAVTLYKNHEFEKAYAVIEEFAVANPDHPEGQTLFTVIREAYLGRLYQACPEDAVPEIAVDFSVLNEKVFTSLEGFLASRINGHWDVKSLIMISPIGDLESMKILKRLLDEGVIRLRRD